MLKKLLQRKSMRNVSIGLALCGMLGLALLASGARAGAQSAKNTPVAHQQRFIVTVLNTRTVAPHQEVTAHAFCPAGYIALRGAVSVYRSGRPNIFALEHKAFTIEENTPGTQYRSWTGKVLNNAQFPLQEQVTATCYLLPLLPK